MTPPEALSNTRRVNFHDPRPPLEIQHLIEREFMVLLEARTEHGLLVSRGTAAVNGAACLVVLEFIADLPRTNSYSLETTLSWAHLPPEHHNYHRSTASAWHDLWTRHFTAATPTDPGPGPTDRYAQLAAPVLSAHAHPESVEAVQEKILSALREGASFSTAHKEGGTRITGKGGRFVRQDYGESNARERFADEAVFLGFLRRFYDWETGRSYPPGNPPSESDRWQLILRLLER